jgi:hypothetical protein
MSRSDARFATLSMTAADAPREIASAFRTLVSSGVGDASGGFRRECRQLLEVEVPLELVQHAIVD